METTSELLEKDISEKSELVAEHWLECYGDSMYRYTLARVRDEDAAEEILQNSLLAGLEARNTFQGRASEKSWLFGILKHKILDHFRRVKHIKMYEISPEEDLEICSKTFDSNGNRIQSSQHWAFDPQKSAENSEILNALSCCLDRLAEKYRSVFVLKEIEGLSSEEICKTFDISPNNLWGILHRARNQLKQCLEKREFNGVL